MLYFKVAASFRSARCVQVRSSTRLAQQLRDSKYRVYPFFE